MVLVLFVGAKQFSVGQQLMLFVVPEDKNLMREHTEILELPGVYRALWQHPSNAATLIGTPYLTKQLRVQRLQDFRNVSLVDGMMTGHHVRLANLFVDRQWLTTAAFDGLVHVRDKTLRRVVACFVSHHRSDFGCAKAIANKSGDLVVVMGYNGSVVAMRKVRLPYPRLRNDAASRLQPQLTFPCALLSFLQRRRTHLRAPLISKRFIQWIARCTRRTERKSSPITPALLRTHRRCCCDRSFDSLLLNRMLQKPGSNGGRKTNCGKQRRSPNERGKKF